MASPAYQFTNEDRSRGGEAAKIAKRENLSETARRSQNLRAIADAATELDVDSITLGAAVKMLEMATAGELPPPRSALDVLRYSQAGQIWLQMHRLLTGQSTSNVAHATIDMDALRERFEALETESHPA